MFPIAREAFFLQYLIFLHNGQGLIHHCAVEVFDRKVSLGQNVCVFVLEGSEDGVLNEDIFVPGGVQDVVVADREIARSEQSLLIMLEIGAKAVHFHATLVDSQ